MRETKQKSERMRAGRKWIVVTGRGSLKLRPCRGCFCPWPRQRFSLEKLWGQLHHHVDLGACTPWAGRGGISFLLGPRDSQGGTQAFPGRDPGARQPEGHTEAVAVFSVCCPRAAEPALFHLLFQDVGSWTCRLLPIPGPGGKAADGQPSAPPCSVQVGKCQPWHLTASQGNALCLPAVCRGHLWSKQLIQHADAVLPDGEWPASSQLG